VILGLNDLLLLSVLGGIVALDGTAVGQFMVSRPLVAATLAGVLVGEAGLGLTVGALLEIFYLSVLPVGGARFPEGGPAAVAATAVAITAGGGSSGLLLGVASGLVWGALGGFTVGLLRRMNAQLALDPHGAGVTPGALARVQLFGIAADFSRGVLLAGSGALLGGFLAALVRGHWPLSEGWTAGLLLAGGAVPLGALIRSFGTRTLLLLLGLAAGLLIGRTV